MGGSHALVQCDGRLRDPLARLQLALSLAGAGILAFHVSFDEVVLALFLTGARNKTLPVKLWESILFEVTPILPAISTLVLVIPIVIVAAIVLMRRRHV